MKFASELFKRHELLKALEGANIAGRNCEIEILSVNPLKGNNSDNLALLVE